MLRVCFRTFLIWALSIGIHAGLIFVLKAQRNKPESIKSVAQKVSLHIRDRSSPQNERGISPHSKPKELRSSGSASGKPRRAMSAKSEAKSRPSVVGESIAGYASLMRFGARRGRNFRLRRCAVDFTFRCRCVKTRSKHRLLGN